MSELTHTERAFLDAARADDQAQVLRLGSIIDAQQHEREVRLAATGALLGAALWYAEHGHAVFPCVAGDKRPATAHGLKDATTDTDQIHTWWAANPHYNIGLLTGQAWDVFDIDGPHGLLAIHEYIDAGGFPPIAAKARTPRGRHYYVPASPVRSNKANFLPGVDVRARGGYVIAPPSNRPEGTYRWFADQHPPAEAA